MCSSVMCIFHNEFNQNFVDQADNQEVMQWRVITSMYLRKPSCWNHSVSPPQNHLCLNGEKFSECFVSWSMGSLLYRSLPCDLSHSDLRHSCITFSTVPDGLCILGSDMALLHITFSKTLIFPTAGIQGPNFGGIGNWWAIDWRGSRIRKKWKGRYVCFLAGFIRAKWNVWRTGFRAGVMISYLEIACMILWAVSPQLMIITSTKAMVQCDSFGY